MSERPAMRESATRPVMSAPEVEAFLEREFPEIYLDGRIWHVEAVGPLTARMRLDFHPRHVRPGGTLSGPSMMTLADLALYVAVLANVGPVALAVTTNLSFNFLRKPPQAALVADTRLLKLGRRLAVGEVTIRSEGADEPVCHATGTYALPG
ncbi:PaaI family thioesterase [Salinarimonas rosea]|uniref:PaaI family thioesterase n=1 Tax=Salinarimonas rosea TaxID=552063 RepID=UPI000417712E